MEKNLIRACVNQDPNAQKEIYDLHAPHLLGICYRYCGNIDLAEDILHHVFVKIFKQIHQYLLDSNFESWLKKMTLESILEHIFENTELNKSFMAEAESTLYEPIEKDTFLNAKDIVETIKSLPIEFRLVINLYSIDGYSHKEISQMLNISESVSRSQYARARMLLAKILNAKGRIQSIGYEEVKIN
ncbi:MAG: RNA polymerase sigma factor [Bacteroidetes bacterium]|nr:RNA polymerase sigma factor [Bacteroidota bacterium]